MGKRAVLFVAVVVLVGMMIPAVALGSLTNDYGLNFAGQAKCAECHSSGADAAKFTALHSGFATSGITPALPDRLDHHPRRRRSAAGRGHQGRPVGRRRHVRSPRAPGSPWATTPPTRPPSTCSGRAARPTRPSCRGTWSRAWSPSPAASGCSARTGTRASTTWCTAASAATMLGATAPLASATATNTVPNPAATLKPTDTSNAGWARDAAKTSVDFVSDPTVSLPRHEHPV